MKLLSDNEYTKLHNQIEESKNKYEKMLSDYYFLNEENRNIKKLFNSFQSKNQKLRNKLEEKDKRINKAIEHIEKCTDSEDINERFLSTGETNELLKILEGEE